MGQSFTDAIAAAEERKKRRTAPQPPPPTTDPLPMTPFRERLAQLRTQQEATKPAPLPTNLDDLERPGAEPPRSEYGRQLDDLKARVTLADAYTRWAGKGSFPQTNKRESIKISCPNPAHPDKHPSAWGNTDKDTWYCEPCSMGGDQWDIAAWYYGFPVPGYKQRFNELMERVGQDFGIVKPAPESTPTVTVTVPEGSAIQVEALPAPATTPSATPSSAPTYDLASLGIPVHTFLGLYLQEALKADVPREFPLFAGLATLSMALGRDLALKLIEEPTHGNLAICLTSPSGSGKGRTTRPATALLRSAFPHDATPLTGGLPAEGVRVLQLPGSAEALIDALAEGQTSSPAMVEFEEMQLLIGKGAGNSSYKSYVIQFADCLPYVSRSSMTYKTNAVVNGFVTFLTATQPHHLRDQFTRRDEGSGLLNRFIFPFGNPVERNAWGYAAQDWRNAQQELQFVRKWIVSLDRNSPDEKYHWVHADCWDDAARDLWVKEFRARCEPDAKGEQGNLLARMDVNMLRLILLFAANATSARIRVEFVEMAFKLYDYIRDCALSLAREIRNTELSDGMKAVLNTVITYEKKYGKPVTLRELKRASAVIRGMNAEELGKSIQKLMAARMLHHVKTKRASGGGGKTGDAWTSDLSQWENASVAVVPA